jgi:transposase InsO family protein
LQRIPGPKAILYYLGRCPDLATARLPRSTRTIWRILKQAGRIEIPGRGRRKRCERPAPMTEWELDFFDIDTVQPEPDTTKQQHLVEALPVIDRGTHLLIGCVPRADYTMVTAIGEVVVIVQRHGLPESIVIDRDPRLVGGNPRADFPSPFVQLWQSLGVKVRICPPRRPDRKPMIERMNLTLLLECVRRFRPATLAEAIVYLAWFEQHYNEERPHQGPTCNNQPPRTAHPVLPERPTVPTQVDPNAWLWHYDGNVLTRRVQRDTSISVGDERYYVRQELVGHQVQVRIAAATKELVVLHEQREVKRLALKGLAPQQALPFDAWVTQLQEAARTGQRRPGGPRQFALPL